MDDGADDLRKVAANYVVEYGSDASAYLRAEASRARLKGDKLSAEVWDDIAEVAELLLERVRH
jgi:hypothetical protein